MALYDSYSSVWEAHHYLVLKKTHYELYLVSSAINGTYQVRSVKIYKKSIFSAPSCLQRYCPDLVNLLIAFFVERYMPGK